MVNCRKTTRGLDTPRVKELTAAWLYARRIGRPLNTMVSLRPLDIDYLPPIDRCKLFASFRNKLGVYARLRGFSPTFVWTREVSLDGRGEHLHVLMHVPRRLSVDFEETLIGWFPRPAEMHVQTADYRVKVVERSGRRHSAIGYLCKQMTPQAWYRRGLTRKAGGPIVGKRGGVSASLTAKAIASHEGAQDSVHIAPVAMAA